ncbi:MAG: aminotransferase class I/II-fold pyridoxal phosphate-dependent enzyme, partial [Syntrophorhabdaceae bacterium]
MNENGFSTRAVHEIGTRKESFRALRFPVYDNVAFDFESAEAMANTFFGRSPEFAYSRITNPTVEVFEQKLTALEDGFGTVAVSSGMAAISTTIFNLVGEGDNIVSASSLFGGTYTFYTNILKPLGIEPRFVAADKPEAFAGAIDYRTRLIFLETISNPCIVVPDFRAISEIAKAKDIPVIADGTVTTPYLFAGKAFGVNIIVHSTTKYISGGAT